MKFSFDEYQKISSYYVKKPTNKRIDKVRTYLDKCGYIMPKPLYKYKSNDIKTWKYIDGIVEECKFSKKIKYISVLNPSFGYIDI